MKVKQKLWDNQDVVGKTMVILFIFFPVMIISIKLITFIFLWLIK